MNRLVQAEIHRLHGELSEANCRWSEGAEATEEMVSTEAPQSLLLCLDGVDGLDALC